MIFSKSFHARLAGFLFLGAGAAALAVFSCSSDPASTLGSEGDLLGSEPGAVVQDTIGVFDDTTYVMNTPIATAQNLEVGLDSLYEHVIILQPGFADLAQQPLDTTRTVLSAAIHLTTADITGGSYPVRFYGLGNKYTEGDAVGQLDSLVDADAIPDPDEANSIERALETSTGVYPIPPALAQQWIRDADSREAVAIIYRGVDERVALIPSQETDDQPYLQVRFTDSVQRTYDIRDDATLFRPRTTTTNLIVSDGYPRRVFVRVEIDSIAKDAAVHTARIRFHIVPGTVVGKSPVLLLYIPDSTDPSKAEFKTGRRITEQAVTAGATFIDFPLTNALFLILQGTLKNNGFAIRCKDENTVQRQVEFYGTEAADSLRPRVYVTTSRPAVFD